MAGEEGAVEELVKQHLNAGRTGPWLLVLDNADDADIPFGLGSLRALSIPARERGGVTEYTTRTLEVAVSLTRSDVTEIGPMNRTDANQEGSHSFVFILQNQSHQSTQSTKECLTLAAVDVQFPVRSRPYPNIHLRHTLHHHAKICVIITQDPYQKEPKGPHS